MPLIYNGTDIKKIIFNGVELTKVVYNGVTVFEESAATPYEYFTFVLLADNTYEIERVDNDLENVIIPSTYQGLPITSIGQSAFAPGTVLATSALKSVVIPNTITNIGNYAFSGCSKLTSVAIPDSVTSIGNRAFSGCIGLTSVTIGSGVTSIGTLVFNSCSSLESITVDSNNTAYSSQDGILYNKDKTQLIETPEAIKGEVAIPDSVTIIGNNAFDSCTLLTNIAIPNSVTSIGGSAFSGCSSLTSVTIPDNVSSIGNYAFAYCTGLTSVIIGNSVTSIGDNAFFYCTALTEITCNSITPPSIGSGTLFQVPSDCIIYVPIRGLNAYKGATYWSERSDYIQPIPTPNEYFTFVPTSDGINYFIKAKDVNNMPADIVIPATYNEKPVTTIEANGFKNCKTLEYVLIPNGVKIIGNYAFRSCSSLTSVTIPNSVTAIKTEAFYNCPKLANVILSSSANLQSIYTKAFYNCPALTSINIPEHVTSIGSQAFYACTKLRSIDCYPTTPPTLGTDALYRVPDNCYIYVPAGSKANYTSASGWGLRSQYIYEM